MWVDGALVIERNDIVYRAKSDVSLTGVSADVYYGTEDGREGAPQGHQGVAVAVRGAVAARRVSADTFAGPFQNADRRVTDHRAVNHEPLFHVKHFGARQVATRRPSRAPRPAASRRPLIPSRAAFSRNARRREPGRRAPPLPSIMPASAAMRSANTSAPANAAGIDGDQQLTDARRRALRIEEGAGLEAEPGAGQRDGQHLHHQRQCRALGAADRRQRTLEGGRGVRGRAAVLVDRPACGNWLALLRRGQDLAARHLAQRQVDDERRRDRAAAPQRRSGWCRRRAGCRPTGPWPWACCRRPAPPGRPRPAAPHGGRRRRSDASA